MKPRILCCLLVSALSLGAQAEILERVVARVNGDIVTLSEFEQRQVSSLQQARVAPEGVERFLRENNQRILQDAIDDLLLVQRGHELGLRVPTDYVEKLVDEIKRENNISSDEQFQQQLRSEGLTLEELKRSVARSVSRRQVLARELETKVAVTDAEALQDYEAHRAEYQRPATAQLLELVVTDSTRAQELVSQARAGADFATLAREHSVAPTAKDGGQLGTLAKGEMAADLERAAFALEPGGVSEPLATSNGNLRILKLVEKREAGVLPFEQARKEIVQRLTQVRGEAEYEKYMAGLRKAAVTIDVRVREVPLQVTMPESTQPTLAPAAAASGATDTDEFSASPEKRPEHVVPAGPQPPREEPVPQP